MKYKTITYQRVKNLGNYESKRLELTAELDDDDNLEEAIACTGVDDEHRTSSVPRLLLHAAMRAVIESLLLSIELITGFLAQQIEY